MFLVTDGSVDTIYPCIRIARREAWRLCAAQGGMVEVKQDGKLITTFRATEMGAGYRWKVEEIATA